MAESKLYLGEGSVRLNVGDVVLPEIQVGQGRQLPDNILRGSESLRIIFANIADFYKTTGCPIKYRKSVF